MNTKRRPPNYIAKTLPKRYTKKDAHAFGLTIMSGITAGISVAIYSVHLNGCTLSFQYDVLRVPKTIAGNDFYHKPIWKTRLNRALKSILRHAISDAAQAHNK